MYILACSRNTRDYASTPASLPLGKDSRLRASSRQATDHRGHQPRRSRERRGRSCCSTGRAKRELHSRSRARGREPGPGRDGVEHVGQPFRAAPGFGPASAAEPQLVFCSPSGNLWKRGPLERRLHAGCVLWATISLRTPHRGGTLEWRLGVRDGRSTHPGCTASRDVPAIRIASRKGVAGLAQIIRTFGDAGR